ncbi:MAG TPA: DUF177 domain-containing protein [Methylomirabilota bacterium]|nr:DUF177 domain-containing protein [Methylomirabilota bacterium]
MSAQPADSPFLWNVAGLLGDTVGADREYEITDATIELPDELTLAESINGTVRLIHTNRGVLAQARLRTTLATECVRCLRPTTVPLDLRIEDEFLPSLDLTTGKAVTVGDEPEALRLNDHHELDLEGSVWDAISLAEPIAPLDRADCPGLCPTCGLPLDEGEHDHPADDIDPRLEALRGFQVESSD